MTCNFPSVSLTRFVLSSHSKAFKAHLGLWLLCHKSAIILLDTLFRQYCLGCLVSANFSLHLSQTCVSFEQYFQVSDIHLSYSFRLVRPDGWINRKHFTLLLLQGSLSFCRQQVQSYRFLFDFVGNTSRYYDTKPAQTPLLASCFLICPLLVLQKNGEVIV